GRDARGVLAAMLQYRQGVIQRRGDFSLADDADDSTHGSLHLGETDQFASHHHCHASTTHRSRPWREIRTPLVALVESANQRSAIVPHHRGLDRARRHGLPCLQRPATVYPGAPIAAPPARPWIWGWCAPQARTCRPLPCSG